MKKYTLFLSAGLLMITLFLAFSLAGKENTPNEYIAFKVIKFFNGESKEGVLVIFDKGRRTSEISLGELTSEAGHQNEVTIIADQIYKYKMKGFSLASTRATEHVNIYVLEKRFD